MSQELTPLNYSNPPDESRIRWFLYANRFVLAAVLAFFAVIAASLVFRSAPQMSDVAIAFLSAVGLLCSIAGFTCGVFSLMRERATFGTSVSMFCALGGIAAHLLILFIAMRHYLGI